MDDRGGWKSKDILTWVILIWGFSRLIKQNEQSPLAGGSECTFPIMTQSGLTIPAWVTQTGEPFGTETTL